MERGAHKVFDRHRAVGQKKIAQVKAAGPGDAAHAEKRDEQIDLFPEAVRGHRNENGGIAEKADRQRHRQPQRHRQQEVLGAGAHRLPGLLDGVAGRSTGTDPTEG